jgi:hypothetical protein
MDKQNKTVDEIAKMQQLTTMDRFLRPKMEMPWDKVRSVSQ